MAYLIMKAEKSPNQPLTSWRNRIADSVIAVWVRRPKKRKADGVVSVQRLANSRPRKNWYFKSSLKAKKKKKIQLKGQRNFPTHIGGDNLIHNLPILILIPSRSTRTSPPRFFDQLCEQPWPSQTDTENWLSQIYTLSIGIHIHWLIIFSVKMMTIKKP